MSEIEQPTPNEATQPAGPQPVAEPPPPVGDASPPAASDAPTRSAAPTPADAEPSVPQAEAPASEPQESRRGRATPAGVHLGTGRRKSAVARVRLVPGSGDFRVNRRPIEEFFTEMQDRVDVVAPLDVTGVRKQWDVFVTVHGGGHTGQAGAVRLGVARALVKAYEQFEPTLRDAGYLTRDARRVERKKPGQRKARRRFQFSKR